MVASTKHKKNIIWILVDGIRPDKLRSCGNASVPRLFLDDVLEQGVLFSNVITAGCNSKMSMHSAFTSLPPAINRMNAYDPDLQILLDPWAVTLTDVLKENGYSTFRFVDAVQYEDFYDIQQVIPAAGFDVWESGGYALLRDTPGHSFDTPGRRDFIERYNRAGGPKFAYIHLLTSHELYPELVKDCTWTSSIYVEGLAVVDDDFRMVWEALEKDDDTIVVVSTDHGVRLDCHLVKDIVENGVNLRDASCRTFCSFIGTGLDSYLIPRMVRNIDIAPTILDLVGCTPILGEGRSLLPVARDEQVPDCVAVIENVGGYEIPSGRPKVTNIWGARTERWKYWVHETRGEFLADLSADPAELRNLVGTGLEVEDELRSLVREQLLDHPKSPRDVYREMAAACGTTIVPQRHDIRPDVSVLLVARDGGTFLGDAIRAVRGQLAVYWELVVVDLSSAGSAASSVEGIDDFRVRYVTSHAGARLADVLHVCRGSYHIAIADDMVLAPNALYEMRKSIRDCDADSVSAVCEPVIVLEQSGGAARLVADPEMQRWNPITIALQKTGSPAGSEILAEIAYSGRNGRGDGDGRRLPCVGKVYTTPGLSQTALFRVKGVASRVGSFLRGYAQRSTMSWLRWCDGKAAR